MSQYKLKGKIVDKHTRCEHWNTDLDIIALKFKCCDTFYPCISCHRETTDHEIQKYDINSDEKVILCGNCNSLLTFHEYTSKTNPLQCPKCSALFNPGCKNHYGLYFDNAEACTR
ncbi:Helper of Tim protein 13 [Nakaseomyces bracarensis]|uniref:Helper of Tim protein 13 n=1 Tax=Nakaseomyces bracarensis TaxID=273131 RepID=A0ABR4NRA0_9SACH